MNNYGNFNFQPPEYTNYFYTPNPYLQNNSNFGYNINSTYNIPNTTNIDYNSDDTGENIRVCVRVRPLNMTETGRRDSKAVEVVSNNTINVKNKNINRDYNYNHCFNESATQEDVFNTCSINVNR